jgi:hypothetical protein
LLVTGAAKKFKPLLDMNAAVDNGALINRFFKPPFFLLGAMPLNWRGCQSSESFVKIPMFAIDLNCDDRALDQALSETWNDRSNTNPLELSVGLKDF